MSTAVRLRPWLGRIVPAAFYVLLIVFLVLYLRHVDFSKLAHLHVNWWYLALATMLALARNYLSAYTWLVILRALGAGQLRLRGQLLYVYAKAWMGRYIPGTAPWILGKIYFASQHGIAKQKLAVSSLLEGGLQLVTLLVFSLVLLVFDNRLDVLGTGFKLLMIAVAVAGVIVLLPPVFNRAVNLAYRLLRRRNLEAEHLVTQQAIIRGTALYLADGVVSGLSLFCIAKGIDPHLAYSDMVFVMGGASLALAAGMLAIFAPGGLGVREGIQLVLFGLIMPKELAVAATVATRLWSVGVDILFFALSRISGDKSSAP